MMKKYKKQSLLLAIIALFILPFFLNSNLYKIRVPINITPTDNKKFTFLFVINMLDTPNKNTDTVCTNIYSESSPNMLGVKILLLVTV